MIFGVSYSIYLLRSFCGIFNDAVSISNLHCVEWMTTDELVRVPNEAVVADFKSGIHWEEPKKL
jgi:hypothetical protein